MTESVIPDEVWHFWRALHWRSTGDLVPKRLERFLESTQTQQVLATSVVILDILGSGSVICFVEVVAGYLQRPELTAERFVFGPQSL